MVSPCIVKNCKNIGTHRFPKNEIKKSQWIQALRHNIKTGLTVRKNSFICSAHFQPTDFAITPTSLTNPDRAPKVLKKYVVPSIFPCNQATQQERQEREEEVIEQEDSLSTETIHFDGSKVQNTYSRILPIKYIEMPMMQTDSADETHMETDNTEDPLKISNQGIELQNTENGLHSLSQNNEFLQELEAANDPLPPLCFDNIVEIEAAMNSVQTQTEGDVLSQEYESVQTQTQIDERIYGFSIHNYKDNAIDAKVLHFYTGLENINKIMLVFYTLRKSTNNLNYYYGPPPERIDPLEQFFITLIILRRHKTFEEITMLFKITLKHVYSIFITWIRFMALQWKNLDLWVDKEHVKAYMPFDFYEQYPATRLILDATECPIKKPKLPLAQQVTFSTYKNRNTIKFLIGITPGGMISYVSPSYGGSATDRQILERSSILGKFHYNDEIMVDKGLNVQDIFLPHGVKLNMPAFFRKGNQIGSETLSSNRKVASKRVHIERVIGMLKTFKILTQPMNQTETLLSSDIVFVIAMLVNFRTNIML